MTIQGYALECPSGLINARHSMNSGRSATHQINARHRAIHRPRRQRLALERHLKERAGLLADGGLIGPGGGLNTRRDIGSRAEQFPISNCDRSGMNPDTDQYRLRQRRVERRQFGQKIKAGADGPIGIASARVRTAETGDNAVSLELRDLAVMSADHGGAMGPVGAHVRAQFLRIEPHRKFGRADQVAEHQSELADPSRRVIRGKRSRRRFSIAKARSAFHAITEMRRMLRAAPRASRKRLRAGEAIDSDVRDFDAASFASHRRPPNGPPEAYQRFARVIRSLREIPVRRDAAGFSAPGPRLNGKALYPPVEIAP